MPDSLFYFVKLAIRKRLARIFVFGVVLSVVALVHIRSQQAVYHAQLKIYIDSPVAQERVPYFSESGVGFLAEAQRRAIIQNQESLVKSRIMYERVKAELGKITFEDDEVKPGAGVLNFPGRHILGEVRRRLREVFFGADVDPKILQSEDILKGYFGSVTVQTDRSNANAFVVGFKSSTPEKALKTTDIIVKGLVSFSRELGEKNNAQLSDFLKARINEVERQISQNTDEIAEFVVSNKIPKDENLFQSKFNEVNESRKNLLGLEQELSAIRTELDFTQKNVETLGENLRKSVTDSHQTKIQSLMQEIGLLEIKLAQPDINGVPAAPGFTKNLASLKKNLAKELEEQQKMLSPAALEGMLTNAMSMIMQGNARLRAKEHVYQNVKTLFTKLNENIATIPKVEAELTRKLLAYNQLVSLQSTLTQHYVDTEIKREATFSPLHILEQPFLDADFHTKEKQRLFVKYCLLAFLAAAALVTFIDFKMGTILGKRQLVRVSHPIYLGSFPHIDRLKGVNLVTVAQRNLEIARTVYKLRRYLSGGPDEKGRVVALVSDMPHSGKSVTSVAFGASLAGFQARVAIVDYDTRASIRSATGYFLHKTTKGTVRSLEAYLEGREEGANVGEAESPVFFCLDHDHQTDDIVTFSRSFINHLEGLRRQFKYIVIDMPPVHLVETLPVLELADCIIICCPEGYSTLTSLEETTSTIDQYRKQGSMLFSLLTNASLSQNFTSLSNYHYYQNASPMIKRKKIEKAADQDIEKDSA